MHQSLQELEESAFPLDAEFACKGAAELGISRPNELWRCHNIEIVKMKVHGSLSN